MSPTKQKYMWGNQPLFIKKPFQMPQCVGLGFTINIVKIKQTETEESTQIKEITVSHYSENYIK